MAKKHTYTAEQDNWLAIQDLPQEKDADGQTKLQMEFIGQFSNRQGWTPLYCKPVSLLKRAQDLRAAANRMKELDSCLEKYLGRTITSEGLVILTRQVNDYLKHNYSPEEIGDRLIYLTEQAGGADQPIISKETDTAEISSNEPEPRAQTSKPHKISGKGWGIVWEGEETPKYDLAKGSGCFYLIINGQIEKTFQTNDRPKLKLTTEL